MLISHAHTNGERRPYTNYVTNCYYLTNFCYSRPTIKRQYFIAFFFLECFKLPNCEKCIYSFKCIRCSEGYALYKPKWIFARAKCRKTCPRNYHKVLRADNKTLECKKIEPERKLILHYYIVIGKHWRSRDQSISVNHYIVIVTLMSINVEKLTT